MACQGWLSPYPPPTGLAGACGVPGPWLWWVLPPWGLTWGLSGAWGGLAGFTWGLGELTWGLSRAHLGAWWGLTWIGLQASPRCCESADSIFPQPGRKPRWQLVPSSPLAGTTGLLSGPRSTELRPWWWESTRWVLSASDVEGGVKSPEICFGTVCSQNPTEDEPPPAPRASCSRLASGGAGRSPRATVWCGATVCG